MAEGLARPRRCPRRCGPGVTALAAAVLTVLASSALPAASAAWDGRLDASPGSPSRRRLAQLPCKDTGRACIGSQCTPCSGTLQGGWVEGTLQGGWVEGTTLQGGWVEGTTRPCQPPGDQLSRLAGSASSITSSGHWARPDLPGRPALGCAAHLPLRSGARKRAGRPPPAPPPICRCQPPPRHRLRRGAAHQHPRAARRHAPHTNDRGGGPAASPGAAAARARARLET